MQDAVNWEAGQQVSVMTTIWKDEQENQNEVCAGSEGAAAELTLAHW